MVWTGSDVIVWGGCSNRGGFGDGAAYDPQRDEWEEIAEAPVQGCLRSSVVWTGQHMIVFDGHGGAAYDPRRDEWEAISAAPLLAAGEGTAAWTGTSMVVSGGSTGPDVGYLTVAAAYDPTRKRWKLLPGLPAPRADHSTIWSGRSLIVWGGATEGGHSLADGASLKPQ